MRRYGSSLGLGMTQAFSSTPRSTTSSTACLKGTELHSAGLHTADVFAFSVTMALSAHSIIPSTLHVSRVKLLIAWTGQHVHALSRSTRLSTVSNLHSCATTTTKCSISSVRRHYLGRASLRTFSKRASRRFVFFKCRTLKYGRFMQYTDCAALCARQEHQI